MVKIQFPKIKVILFLENLKSKALTLNKSNTKIFALAAVLFAVSIFLVVGLRKPVSKQSPEPINVNADPTKILDPLQVLGHPYKPNLSASRAVYGIASGSSLASLDDTSLAKTLDDIAALGVSWIRFDLEWNNVQETSSKTYDWKTYDRLVIGSAKRNLNVLGILDYTPKWARLETCRESSKCPPKDAALFAEFAATAAERYKDIGATHWEIWNEPNNQQFWANGANPNDYTKLLTASYKSIKQKAPEAVVITGGLSPQANNEMSLSPLKFLQGIYNAGAKDYFDAIGDHPYTFPFIPSYPSAHAWNQMSDAKNSLRAEMVKNGDKAKKIWITEYGAPTNGPGETATIHNFADTQNVWHVNEELQSLMLQDSLKLYTSYDYVGSYFWYSYRDAGTSASDNENFFGLVRNDYSKKPSYTKFADFIRNN